jgi:hypothetical protein
VFEIAVAGMHGDHAVLDAREKVKGILAGQESVGRIVVDPEVGMFAHRLQEIAEDVCRLGKFGILPEAILIVVLKDERHAVLRGKGETVLDGSGGELNALLAGNIRTTLAAQDAAEGGPQGIRHFDPPLLLLNFLRPEGGIGMGEIGRTTEHRDLKVHLFARLPIAGPGGGILKVDDEGIEFHSVHIETGGKVEIVREAHGAVHEGFQFCLGKGSELGHLQDQVRMSGCSG